jgi:hypothetical protein
MLVLPANFSLELKPGHARAAFVKLTLPLG